MCNQNPLGIQDGPNFYCFLHNNPLTHIDRLGLAVEDPSKEAAFHDYFYGDVEKHCFCQQHRTCKRGGDIGNSRLGGIALGISDYSTQTVDFFLEPPLILSLTPQLKMGYESFLQANWQRFHEIVDEGLVHAIGFDPSHEASLRYKKAARIGLTVLDILRGNIKDIRKGASFVKKEAELSVKIFDKNAKHIFRDSPGHLSDTIANRNLLIKTASNSRNYLGTDKYGNNWYAQIQADGKQIWVSERNGQIRNGGINGFPAIFNSETGLSMNKGN